MAGRPKISPKQLKAEILKGRTFEQIAEMYGYTNWESVYNMASRKGLLRLYRQVQRERKKQAKQVIVLEAETQNQAEEEPLFETRNGKVVVNNLHLVLGHVEPYLPGKFGKVV